jgi:hypothetical protein
VELLKAAAQQRLAAGQDELDLGLEAAAAGGPLPIIASRMGCLLDALGRAYRVLGFDQASGGDEVIEQLVLGREPDVEPGLRQGRDLVAGLVGVSIRATLTVVRQASSVATG